MQAVSGKTNWTWAAEGATTIYNYKETPCDVSVTAIVVLIHCKLSVSDLTLIMRTLLLGGGTLLK